jgi:hypothetical protein
VASRLMWQLGLLLLLLERQVWNTLLLLLLLGLYEVS